MWAWCGELPWWLLESLVCVGTWYARAFYKSTVQAALCCFTTSASLRSATSFSSPSAALQQLSNRSRPILLSDLTLLINTSSIRPCASRQQRQQRAESATKPRLLQCSALLLSFENNAGRALPGLPAVAHHNPPRQPRQRRQDDSSTERQAPRRSCARLQRVVPYLASGAVPKSSLQQHRSSTPTAPRPKGPGCGLCSACQQPAASSSYRALCARPDAQQLHSSKRQPPCAV